MLLLKKNVNPNNLLYIDHHIADIIFTNEGVNQLDLDTLSSADISLFGRIWNSPLVHNQNTLGDLYCDSLNRKWKFNNKMIKTDQIQTFEGGNYVFIQLWNID